MTHAQVVPGKSVPKLWASDSDELEGGATLSHGALEVAPGFLLPTRVVQPTGADRHPARLLLVDDMTAQPAAPPGTVVMTFTPRPSPQGTEETKAALLGPFYLTELRAELSGKTLLGMRVDDVLRAVDYLASRPDVEPGEHHGRSVWPPWAGASARGRAGFPPASRRRHRRTRQLPRAYQRASAPRRLRKMFCPVCCGATIFPLCILCSVTE